ncbi:uncharacterized protein [Erythrolamprus reginae]|uniref:uncharacterized protein n=1 Tax=Erythrolamprus reginae TaxID=121349 RepID=UPI00396D0112
MGCTRFCLAMSDLAKAGGKRTKKSVRPLQMDSDLMSPIPDIRDPTPQPSKAERRRDLTLQRLHERAARALSPTPRIPNQAPATITPSGSAGTLAASVWGPAGLPNQNLIPDTSRPPVPLSPTILIAPPVQPGPSSEVSQQIPQVTPPPEVHPSSSSTFDAAAIQRWIDSAIQRSIELKLSTLTTTIPSRPVPAPPVAPLSLAASILRPTQDSWSDSSAEESDSSDKEPPEGGHAGLSEDEEASPALPISAALFPAELFSTILLKARSTAGLTAPPTQAQPSASQVETLWNPYTEEQDIIPAPPLFVETITKQCLNPAAGPAPSNLEKRFFNVAPELASFLEPPAIDFSVLALHSSENLPGKEEDLLKGEDRKIDQLLQKSHQSAAWAIKGATTSSFFARSMLIYIRQLQEQIPASDISAQQSLNKMFATCQLLADTTLYTSRFAAKTMASSIAARRMTWLKKWQVDIKHKWRFATAEYKGKNLFGDVLEPFLIDSKDKKKILPSSQRKSSQRPSPYYRRPFRQTDQSFSYYRSSAQQSYKPHNFQDKNSRGRGTKRPFRGSAGSRQGRRGPKIPDVVEVRSHRGRYPVPILPHRNHHHGRQSVGMGSSLRPAAGSGPLGRKPVFLPHQLAGVTHSFPGPQELQPPDCRTGRPHQDRQYGHQGTYQPSRGHQVQDSDARGQEDRPLGRETLVLSPIGTHIGDRQHTGGCPQPGNSKANGVEIRSESFSANLNEVRQTINRSVCFPSQHPTSPLLLPLPVPGGGELRCPPLSLAQGTTVRFSSITYPSPSHPQDIGGASGGNIDSSLMAQATLVCGLKNVVGGGAMANTSEPSTALPGVPPTPGPRQVPLDRLAFERSVLRSQDFDNDVIDYIHKARKPSTERIYSSTWKTFSSWCESQGLSPIRIPLSKVLKFLKHGLDKGLSPNTIKRQTAALSSIIACDTWISLAHVPLVSRFLRGVSNSHPPVVHRFPTWDLPKVLYSLTEPPYEPLQEASLRYLSFKVSFLIAITTARRISELAALSVREDLCLFHQDKVVLRLDPSFLPKINSIFHRSQDIILPTFCSRPSHPSERRWHTLDVRRALRVYLKRTRPIRQSEALFIFFSPQKIGLKASSSTIGRWIRGAIAKAYDVEGVQRPLGITAHSTRSAASSAAWATQCPLEDLCKAATWTSLTPFIRHYKIDKFASAQAAFGRRVLQQVVEVAHPSGQ